MAFAVEQVNPTPSERATPTSLGASRILHIARLALCSCAALVLALGIGLTLYGATHTGRIYSGVSVAGVDLSGMSRTEAASALDAQFNTYLNAPVDLTYG